MLTALFALPVLPGESLSVTGYLGILLGFAGVFILVVPPAGLTLASSVWGPVEIVGAAVSFAIGSVFLRVNRPEGETFWGISVQFAIATVLLLAVLPILDPRPSLPDSRGVLLSLVYLVAAPSLVGYALYFSLHHRVGPGRANVVAYVNPVAAIVVGTLLFGEALEWWELAGFALVLIGLTLVLRPGRVPRPADREDSPPEIS
jgi:drug/metabolite transporter (DMT)-like permease